jgi:hypothetical protein
MSVAQMSAGMGNEHAAQAVQECHWLACWLVHVTLLEYTSLSWPALVC